MVSDLDHGGSGPCLAPVPSRAVFALAGQEDHRAQGLATWNLLPLLDLASGSWDPGIPCPSVSELTFRACTRLCPPEGKCARPRPRVAEGPCWPGEELRRLGLDFHAKKTGVGRQGVQPQLRAPTSSLGLDPENVGVSLEWATHQVDSGSIRWELCLP